MSARRRSWRSELILRAERAVNGRFVEQQRLRRTAAVVGDPSELPPAVPGPRAEAPPAPLVGSVVLDRPDPELGERFYIGPRDADLEGTTVVSWVSPVAEVFYRGRKAHDPRAMLPLAGRRTFTASGLDIVDYADDLEPGVLTIDQEVSSLPAGPTALPRRRRRGSPAEEGPGDSSETEDDGAGGVDDADGPEADEGSEVDEADAADEGSEVDDADDPEADDSVVIDLRAGEVVLEMVNRRRSGRLRSLLSTLQPDQYALVTTPPDRTLVVQGEPGTGKTVVAAHRVAWLTHDERPGRLDRVLFAGPSALWREHVQGALDELGVSRAVDVVGVPELMAQLATPFQVLPRTHDDPVSADWALGEVAARAVTLTKQRGTWPADAGEAAQLVLDTLCRSATLRRRASTGSEVSAWLARLARHPAPSTAAEYVLFRAAIADAVRPPRHDELYDHLVIDEAQDLRPLECRLLLRRARPGAAVTLAGDMNQRRADVSYTDWDELAAAIDRRAEPVVLDIGYRSTAQILHFAGRLLPRNERSSRALVLGDPVRTVRSGRRHVARTTVDEAERLVARLTPGLVAVISVAGDDVRTEMLARGWRREENQRYRRDGALLHLLTPEQARGLEFDAVVVHEPGRFPRKDGRYGPLYMSLTRATRRLVVVYTGRLPGGLKKVKR